MALWSYMNSHRMERTWHSVYLISLPRHSGNNPVIPLHFFIFTPCASCFSEMPQESGAGARAKWSAEEIGSSAETCSVQSLAASPILGIGWFDLICFMFVFAISPFFFTSWLTCVLCISGRFMQRPEILDPLSASLHRCLRRCQAVELTAEIYHPLPPRAWGGRCFVACATCITTESSIEI